MNIASKNGLVAGPNNVAYGTAKAGVGISAMGVLRPDLIVKSQSLPPHASPEETTVAGGFDVVFAASATAALLGPHQAC